MEKMLADIEALNAEIRKLHEQLTETAGARDLHEKLAASAVETAEKTAGESRRRFRQVLISVGAVAVVLLGLVLAVGATYAYTDKTNARLSILEDYVQGRGELRDRETDRLEEQIRRGLCDLLDQLPSTPLLDGPRTKYGCGPGTGPIPPGAI